MLTPEADQVLLALGRFNVYFERACESMRQAISLSLRSQGLRNQQMEQVIIGDTAAAELQVMLGALCNHLPQFDANDRKMLRALWKEIKELTEQRNGVVHSAWQFLENPGPEVSALAVRPHTKQNSGAIAEIRALSVSHINDLIERAKRIQVLLARLTTSVTQPQLKLSTIFAEPT